MLRIGLDGGGKILRRPGGVARGQLFIAARDQRVDILRLLALTAQPLDEFGDLAFGKRALKPVHGLAV